MPPTLTLGPLALDPAGDTLRVWFDGVEVVREVACPIRDADWRTLSVTTTEARHDVTADGVTLARRFRSDDGAFDGDLAVAASVGAGTATVTVTLTLTPLRAKTVNRAGFVLLHPAAVAGTALAVVHGDGAVERSRFPARVSPGQPVRDIAGLRHTLHGIAVDIAFTGDTFEMEDQRNWTDASFKTYCRPLARPRPYPLAAGETVRQSIAITLSGTPAIPAAPATGIAATLPELALAHEPALTGPAVASGLPGTRLLLRVDARTPDGVPDLAPGPGGPVTLEIVADAPADLALVAACARAGLAPDRVVALPRAYLASHQPEGPWPTPTPADFLAPARAAFPDAAIGSGALTNFTEFNRCPPDPAEIDFATFGTTAIVHAADDRSVRETLEAFPAIFASAAALAPGCPLHLGLVAIAMRSNPYGSAVASNPDRRRRAMAMDDPRQVTPFAAAFALGAIAEAARAGVASLAPAMAAGPIAPGPALGDLLAALAPHAGAPIRIDGGPGRLLVVTAGTRAFAANLGAEAVTFAGRPLASMEIAS